MIQGDFQVNGPDGPTTYVEMLRRNYAEHGEPFPEHVQTVSELAKEHLAMCSRVLDRLVEELRQQGRI